MPDRIAPRLSKTVPALFKGHPAPKVLCMVSQITQRGAEFEGKRGSQQCAPPSTSCHVITVRPTIGVQDRIASLTASDLQKMHKRQNSSGPWFRECPVCFAYAKAPSKRSDALTVLADLVQFDVRPKLWLMVPTSPFVMARQESSTVIAPPLAFQKAAISCAISPSLERAAFGFLRSPRRVARHRGCKKRSPGVFGAHGHRANKGFGKAGLVPFSKLRPLWPMLCTRQATNDEPVFGIADRGRSTVDKPRLANFSTVRTRR